ncbi:hypothetical protein PUN28_016226 [Cardiocondyla obscurior]|uniref:Uncharacterized protein n=1 Tax=Cardiocondyla obscurior TaxID=286306 RepID=A0AAW2ESN4_9HYME
MASRKEEERGVSFRGETHYADGKFKNERKKERKGNAWRRTDQRNGRRERKMVGGSTNVSLSDLSKPGCIIHSGCGTDRKEVHT